MNYFAFDVETTGLKPGYHEIIQLAAIILDDDLNELGRGQFRVQAKHWDRMEKEAMMTTGINPATWTATHSTPEESIDKMYNFVVSNTTSYNNITLLAHNIEFDMSHLQSFLKENDRPFNFKPQNKLDTMQMARVWSMVNGINIKYYSLSFLCEFFEIELNNAHDAMADIDATVKIAKYIVDDLKKKISASNSIFENKNG